MKKIMENEQSSGPRARIERKRSPIKKNERNKKNPMSVVGRKTGNRKFQKGAGVHNMSNRAERMTMTRISTRSFRKVSRAETRRQ